MILIPTLEDQQSMVQMTHTTDIEIQSIHQEHQDQSYKIHHLGGLVVLLNGCYFLVLLLHGYLLNKQGVDHPDLVS
jgi:hypothetical protein